MRLRGAGTSGPAVSPVLSPDAPPTSKQVRDVHLAKDPDHRGHACGEQRRRRRQLCGHEGRNCRENARFLWPDPGGKRDFPGWAQFSCGSSLADYGIMNPVATCRAL